MSLFSRAIGLLAVAFSAFQIGLLIVRNPLLDVVLLFSLVLWIMLDFVKGWLRNRF